MATATTLVQESLSVPRLSRQGRLIAVTAVVLAAFAPLVGTHFYQLWHRPHYQFFPLVLVGSAVLAAARLRRLDTLQAGAARVGWGLAGAAWLLLAVSELTHASSLATVAALILLLAVIYAAGGTALIKQLLPAWLFLWLVIPLPFGFDNSLVLGMQRWTSSWSSAVLDQFGVVHLFTGNVLEVAGHRLFVEEACAGVNSLFSIVACTIFYVFWARVPIIRAIFLTLSAISWVLLANITRVCIVAYMIKARGVDLTEGWRHDVLGYLIFAGALAMIWSTDRLLLFLASSRRRTDLTPESVPAPDAPKMGWSNAWPKLRKSWLGSWATAGLFGAVFVAHLVVYEVPALGRESSVNRFDPTRLEAGTLPEKLAGWRRDKFERTTRNPGSAFGEFSSTWTYRADTHAAVFSVDYPYPSWHEAHECYMNQGWDLEKLTDHAEETASPGFYRAATFKKAGMRFGYLFYSEFDRSGRTIEAERRGMTGTIERYEAAVQRWTTWPISPPPRQIGSVMQFQLFIETQTPLSSEELDGARQRFLANYRTIHERLFHGSEP